MTPEPLAGRSALITGVSRRAGIGFAIARHLSLLGADVFCHSWAPHDAGQPWGDDASEPAELVTELAASGRRAEHLALDLAGPSAPEELVSEAFGVLGHLDIVIANHARSSSQSLDELTAEELEASYRVNSSATLLLIKAWAAQHDDARAGGRVVLMSSGQHLAPMLTEVPYASSKAAVQGVTATLAAHLAGRGVTVNTVNPGPTDTGWACRETYQSVLGSMPFGRWGRPEDAARLVGWLCTDEAAWITGQTIDSEGGFRRS